jgi:2-C-methyl-D-erythritol 2,4-cyclodiphosphate synthase
MFPNTDDANRNRDSAEMLRLAYGRVKESGFRVVNLDCILFAEHPQLAPHNLAIRQRIADLLGIAPTAVGLKAKTGEGVGAVGTNQAMMAQCVALLELNTNP